jgi:hypothetical protein
VSSDLIDEGVAKLEFDRGPDNYLDTALVAAIADGLAMLNDDPACRVILLVSVGKHFCAGVKFSGTQPEEERRARASLYMEALRLFESAKPLVSGGTRCGYRCPAWPCPACRLSRSGIRGHVRGKLRPTRLAPRVRVVGDMRRGKSSRS